jgi:tRNA-uridine 2-sulfurtransferase
MTEIESNITSVNIEKGSVIIAMSGGVDSSVAAALLVNQGYKVMGITMKLWGYVDTGGNIVEESRCCSLDDIYNAKDVCAQLGIPHYTLDFSEKFRDTVITNFVDEYKHGRTPNPCIVCNTKIKWESLLDKVDELGFDYIATGHYANKVRDSESGQWMISKGKDSSKDQSYALWGVGQEALSRTLFPLGTLTKKEVRQMAAKSNLKSADTPESQEICFVPDDNYRRFLNEKYPDEVKDIPKGNFVDGSGKIMGQHEGIHQYTIGQRKGLGIATGERIFVNRIDVETNNIYVGSKEETLFSSFIVHKINLFTSLANLIGQKRDVMIRYNSDAKPARIFERENSELLVIFDSPQSAITPGQSAVFFQGDNVLGGGNIKSVILDEFAIKKDEGNIYAKS